MISMMGANKLVQSTLGTKGMPYLYGTISKVESRQCVYSWEKR